MAKIFNGALLDYGSIPKTSRVGFLIFSLLFEKPIFALGTSENSLKIGENECKIRENFLKKNVKKNFVKLFF